MYWLFEVRQLQTDIPLDLGYISGYWVGDDVC